MLLSIFAAIFIRSFSERICNSTWRVLKYILSRENWKKADKTLRASNDSHMAQLHIILCCNFLPAETGTHSNAKLKWTCFRKFSKFGVKKLAKRNFFCRCVDCLLEKNGIMGRDFPWWPNLHEVYFVAKHVTCAIWQYIPSIRLRNSHSPALLTRLIFYSNFQHFGFEKKIKYVLYDLHHESCLVCSCLFANEFSGRQFISIYFVKGHNFDLGRNYRSIRRFLLVSNFLLRLGGSRSLFVFSFQKKDLNSCDACKSMFRNSDSCSLLQYYICLSVHKLEMIVMRCNVALINSSVQKERCESKFTHENDMQMCVRSQRK